MTGASAPAHEPTPLDPRRHPAALSNAIARAWRPYRWRAYAVAVLAGIVVGGIAAPIVTTSVLLALHLGSAAPPDDLPWPEAVWLVVFALAVPVTGATVFARWQPPRLRRAAQTYVWLAMRAEANWARVFGAQPVPRDERGMRAHLLTIPETPETAGQRFGLWIALLELDRARAAAALMPDVTARERYGRASAVWLIDFVEGRTAPLEPLQSLTDAMENPDERMEAAVEVAANRARVAFCGGEDWQTPLAAARDQLGTAPESLYRRLLWRPTFRTLLGMTVTGVAVYWAALTWFEPYFPRP